MTGPEHRRSWRRQRRSLAVIAGAAALIATVGACSSAGSSSTSSSAAAAATGGSATTAGSAASSCVAAANNYLKPWDSPPTTLSSAYTALSAKPPTGDTVIQLVNGTIPSDGQSFQQLTIAAHAIGWKAQDIVFDGTVADLNAKFQQAVTDKPTAIVLSGWPPEVLQRPLAAAKAAGIVVGLNSVIDQASGYPGYASNTNGAATSKEIGEMNAYMFMRESDCKGSAAIFNLAEFPILTIATNAFQATVKANCPDCTVSYSAVQSTDIGTPALPSAVVSKLQASPSTKYVYAIIGNVADGLASALSQAGITGVKIFGQVPDATSIAALRNGSNAWWIDQSSLMNGWTAMDGILRVMATKQPISDTGGYPLAILTPQNVPAGTSIPVYPANYQSDFEKLWGVG